MSRIARVVVPCWPHHVTQRGNRRQPTFFCDDDYLAYLGLMAAWCQRCGVAIWAYCLMPNHVHLIAVPESEAGLRRAIGEAHRRYTARVNFRLGWRGHLWQGRFASYVMDEVYLLRCARYVELNPVRAGLCARPSDYPWSSAAAHATRADDRLVQAAPLLELDRRWNEHLTDEIAMDTMAALRRHEGTGRPLGGDGFVTRVEAMLGRVLHPRRRGPKKKLVTVKN